ncbi:FadR/GntR family transcriptional regulator [Clostridium chauvoei]|uniref:FadR family transcriptional regulator n=2 Tax=Clostridium chauvoei TaxID=46867 RepID=A0ABD4RJ63_9CLOT|nr:FadR/GntR family transcriptional regulator [Clostridium chauvoei]ATD54164.1 GntR family transcriptional regulator [Clostridium chauvoei]ATD58155.1 GntR family transcriptional regulator [Clostridium chauvoei]MBX7281347.1 FadR family transcriptional regulator [Clostridium chauvoei]MBX7283829.1 FadR family transcriptional regulator [Clostridium chauvoei]MBX7286436.1 FadR family transcriptional regulator [Clostridium chauvoei]
MFNQVKNTKVYEQIVEQIKSMVEDEILKKGDKLPSERVMAEDLGVSRASVREALRALEVVGLIESKQGAGNYIKEDFGGLISEPLSIMFMLQGSDPIDIFELREVIELETVVLAARKITDTQLEGIKDILNELKENFDEDQNVILDKKFHYMIAEASGNKLIIDVLEVLSQLIDNFIKDSRKNILADTSNKEELDKLHDKLYDAIKNRDESKAHYIMKEHFSLIKRYIS